MYSYNSIEDDPKYKEIFEKIDQEVREEVGDNSTALWFWLTKIQILKDKYGND